MATNGTHSTDVVPLWRDNKALPIDHSRLHPVISASSGRTVYQYQSATVDDAIHACDSARAGFKAWKNATVVERRDVLHKFAMILERDAERFVRLQREETSASQMWAQQNVKVTAAFARESAACISNVTGAIPQIDKPDSFGFAFKEPVGTVLVIPPWNAALILASRAMCGAIAVGCSVVLKASETCPATHHALVEALVEAGLPPGVLNKVQVARNDAAQVTEKLIAHSAVRKIEFIGSAAVGRIIGSVAAKHLKPVLMELGGKSPAIVLDDADLEQAAEMCAKAALMHHGQICFSTERIIVQEKVAEKFKSLLAKAVTNNAGMAGSAVSEAIAAHAHEVHEDAQAKGLEYLVGSPEYINGDSKNALRPSIILEPRNGARIIDEETFGPSASLYVVADDQAAIDRANDSSYGLNACIYTKDMARGLKMARGLEYGQVHMNTQTVYTDGRGPQGGVKGSGWGRQNQTWGLEEYVQLKYVTFAPPRPTTQPSVN